MRLGELGAAATDLKHQTNLILRYLDNINWDAVFAKTVTVVLELILFSVLFFVINSIGKRVINHAFKAYKNSSHLAPTRAATMHTLTRNIFSYTVLFFYFYAILSALGVPVGTLLAGAGVVGLALGLGAQGFVSDVVTGFFIILEGQFDVGDSVVLGSVSGKVLSLGLRTTIVQSTDGTVNYVPNRNISIVSNLSRSQMQVLIKLPLKADTDLPKVRSCIAAVNQKMLPNYPQITSGPDILGLAANANGSFTYQIVMFVKNGEQFAVQREFLAAYVQALNEAGIQLAAPTPAAVPASK